MSSIVPTISGPKRPQDKVLLTDAPTSFKKVLEESTNKKENLLLENKTRKLKRVKKDNFKELFKVISPDKKNILTRVKITDKSLKINEDINNMINDIDKMID